MLVILFSKIYMWQKVYNFSSDGYISLKNLYKFSLIYKHKYVYLSAKNLKSKLISRKKETEKIYIVPITAVQSRSNVKPCILECKYPSFCDILFQHY